MTTFKVLVSYTVTDETYIEAGSHQEALEILKSGKVDAEFSCISTDDWEIVEVSEVQE